MKNYHPISNLTFIYSKGSCKAFEKHLYHNDLHDSYNFAYHRAAESALLKVHSNIREVPGEGAMNALIMLDLSAAFDVIDQLILLKL